MKNRLADFLVAALACGFVSAGAAEAQLVRVQIASGFVEGYSHGSVAIFKGVPYAAPPVGDFRWKAPQPVKSWDGARECKTWPASAMQAKPGPFMMWSEEFIAPPEPLSEDCLYLNLWTAARSARQRRPVVVWIHGGGFTSGAGSCAVYDGEEMAKKGVVFVTINYRLGVFGFLALPELSAESPMKVSGNYGLLDQIAALQWVKRNIAAFGGDPDNVTIAGQSAGSMSVNLLIASPLAKGLFQKAIAESGGIFSDFAMRTLPDAENSGLSFMEKVKAPGLAELRQMCAEDIQKAVAARKFGGFNPIRDGAAIPVDLVEHFKVGLQNDVPVLTGWVTGDGTLQSAPNGDVDAFLKMAKERFGDRENDFLKLFPAGNKEQCRESQQKLSLLTFAVLSSRQLALFSKRPCYLYEFSHVPVDKPGFPDYGAFHTSEVPYALHTLHLWNRPWTPADRELERVMSSYWANFARTGNPNGSGLPKWPSYNETTQSVQELDDRVAANPGLYAGEIAFLQQR